MNHRGDIVIHLPKQVDIRVGQFLFVDLFDIKDELDVNEITFKTTGSVDTGLDTNVTLNVKENDENQRHAPKAAARPIRTRKIQPFASPL